MSIFNSMENLLVAGESFVLATILSRSGSAPRAVGTRMVVRSDATIIGTIGGGILEAKIQKMAKDVFQHGGAVVKEFVLNAEDAGRIGMICGGQVEVLINFVDASDPRNLELIRKVLEVRDSGKGGWLITRIPAAESGKDEVPQHILNDIGTHVGGPGQQSVEGLIAPTGSKGPQLVLDETGRFLVEPLNRAETVLIFGAGHISQKLSPLTNLVGFRTVVLDDREEFANRARFESADEVIVLSSLDDAMRGLDVDERSYIVLVTRGHAHDKTLLSQALKTKAGYIGMIGSRSKRDAVYESLRGEGFAPEVFDRVNSPIGLDIGAETPEEIAVSIVAEIIDKRAKKS
jgi:xanthine dehydrogenase accessory factor